MNVFTILIIAVFVVGYLSIALEGVTRINKSAVALLMCVVCWGFYATGGYVEGYCPRQFTHDH